MQHKMCINKFTTKNVLQQMCRTIFAALKMQHKMTSTKYAAESMQQHVCSKKIVCIKYADKKNQQHMCTKNVFSKKCFKKNVAKQMKHKDCSTNLYNNCPIKDSKLKVLHKICILKVEAKTIFKNVKKMYTKIKKNCKIFTK